MINVVILSLAFRVNWSLPFRSLKIIEVNTYQNFYSINVALNGFKPTLGNGELFQLRLRSTYSQFPRREAKSKLNKFVSDEEN